MKFSELTALVAEQVLTEQEVHVWRLCLPKGSDPKAGSNGKPSKLAASYLSDQEHKQSHNFTHIERRQEFIWSRIYLRFFLAHYMKVQAEKISWTVDARGKPYLPDSRWHFSWSHCRGSMVFAFSLGSPVGVDVEAVRPLRFLAKLEKRVYSPPEMEMVKKLQTDQQGNSQERLQLFFNVWTKKEAIAKASGKGLAMERLRSLYVGHGRPEVIYLDHKEQTPSPFKVWSQSVEPYVVSVASSGKISSIRWMDGILQDLW